MNMRGVYQEKMKAQLKEWGAKIEQLRARAEHVSADLKVKYHEQFKMLREKQEIAQQQFHALRNAGEHVWEGLKVGMERAWQELKEGVDKARAKFK